MAINLRYIGKELQRQLKVRAASEDVTIESLCVRYLWWGIERQEVLNGNSKDADIRGTGSDATGGNGRSGDGASLPVLPKATRKPVKLYTVQPVRGKLVAGGGHQPGPTDEPHKGHRVYKSGDGRYCGDCKVNF